MFRLRHSAALVAAAALGLAGGAVALGATGAGHHSDATPFTTVGSSTSSDGSTLESEATETPDATQTPEATEAPEATETPEASETPDATETPEVGDRDNEDENDDDQGEQARTPGFSFATPTSDEGRSDGGGGGDDGH